MSIKNYRFVSPGVFVNEIDNSQLPASPAGIGPVVIGRAEKGPGLRPITVESFSEFVEVFGAPIPGTPNGDVWRLGANVGAPSYGAYAAQAYLRNSSPLTYVRLMGNEDPAATSAGKAGWDADGATDGQGTAYGLVIFQTNSTLASPMPTGSLAAIIYSSETGTVPMLSGAIAQSGPTAAISASYTLVGSGSGLIVQDDGVTQGQFTLVMRNSNYNGDMLRTVFNFNTNSSKYIRKVLNTTPQRVNPDLVDSELNYWLGESFDRFVQTNVFDGYSGRTFAAIVPIVNGVYDGDDFRSPVQSAQSPAIIGCDLLDRPTGSVTNAASADKRPTLFTVHALNQPGDWTNRNLKVSIQEIKVSTNDADPYGTFNMVVRKATDSDNVVKVVEQFNNLNLNPESLDYVGRKVGDKYLSWNTDERRYVEAGEWENRSSYIRVAVNEDIVGENASLLPFGFKGIVKYADENGLTALTSTGNWLAAGSQQRFNPTSLTSAPGQGWTTGSVFIVSSSVGGTVTAACLNPVVYYPAPEFRVSASAGNLNNPTDAYFGLQTSTTAGGTRFAESTIDLLRPRGGMVSAMFAGASSTYKSTISEIFTLDDIVHSTKDGGYWVSGSHMSGTSLTVTSGAIDGVLDKGFDRFTVPLYGGFDGLNVKELNPFRNSGITTSATDKTSYAFNSLRQAIDSVSDPEVVEMNLATIPGLTHEGLTTNLLNVCEDRADALAIIDLPGGFAPRAEAKVTARNNTASDLTTIISNLRARGLNSSYGCCFYPWVRARDTLNGSILWLPPSIAALGTFSSSQKKTQVWFAPAGFNRGGLTEGSAGIPVIDVSQQLRRKDRDNLYSANINPIAKFPAEGIVIFGQKTLQVTPSALDRINVRRLMIFLKKRISQAATTLLFDPNVETTWQRFISLVEPILAGCKTNFGLTDYKLVLDKTTTTPELVDRNILYAQIFLKPTRAIEYIAIDFNITRTGASFDD